MLVGCGSDRIKTEVQEVLVPIVYCPAPPVIERPTLSIHKMNARQTNHPGEVVKHYKATVKELQGYSIQLERVIEQYGETSKSYEEIKQELLLKLKQDDVIDTVE
jgi:hypothetical protein